MRRIFVVNAKSFRNACDTVGSDLKRNEKQDHSFECLEIRRTIDMSSGNFVDTEEDEVLTTVRDATDIMNRLSCVGRP